MPNTVSGPLGLADVQETERLEPAWRRALAASRADGGGATPACQERESASPSDGGRVSTRPLVHLVASTQFHRPGRFYFMAWEGLAPEQQRAFEASGGAPWWLPELSLDAAQQFMDGYCAMTDEIETANGPASIWWYTWSASRDRFYSRILEQTELVARLTASSRELPNADIVLWCPHPQLAVAIRLALAVAGVAVRRDVRSRFQWWKRQGAQRLIPWRCGAQVVLRAIVDGVALRGRRSQVQPQAPRGRIQLLLVTWLRSADLFGEIPQGTYFGRLPSLAQQRGIEVALFGGLMDRATRLRVTPHEPEVLVSSMPEWLRPIDLVRAFVVGMLAPIRLPRSGWLRDDAVRALVHQDIRENRGMSAVYCLLMESALRRFIEKHKPEKMVHICENNPWEKVCERAVAGLPRRPEICGYLHCVVVPSHTKYILTPRDRAVRPWPDRLICTGERAREIMIGYGHARDNTVAACAWRFEHLRNTPPRRGMRRRGQLLVVLDGLPTAVQLIWFMHRALAGQTAVKARLRAHPQYSLDRLLREASWSLDGHPTLSASRHASIFDDFSEADLVVYRGSVVALEAGYLGIPLIQVRTPNILTDDPLFELSELKRMVTRPEDFLPVVEEMVSISEEQLDRSLTAFRRYVDDYLTQPSEATLAHFLPGAAGGGNG